MKLQGNFVRIVGVGLMALALSGCASGFDRKTNNTLLGGGLGAAAGAVFSGGDPLYTVGGAAAGGLLGNVLTEDRKDRKSNNWNKRDSGSSKHYKRNDRRSNDRHHKRGR